MTLDVTGSGPRGSVYSNWIKNFFTSAGCVEIMDLNGAFACVAVSVPEHRWMCCPSAPHGGAIAPLFNPTFYFFIVTDYLHIYFGSVLKYRIFKSIYGTLDHILLPFMGFISHHITNSSKFSRPLPRM